MEKNCTRCAVSQPLDDAHFGKRKTKTGQGWRWDSWCRDCYKANTKRIQTKDPERKKQKDKEWREKNSERYHAQKRLKYAQMSMSEKQRMKDSARRHNQKMKLAALTAYAQGKEIACECCGENIIGFLSLDHRQNNGKAHREELGGRLRGTGFYQHVRDEGYPMEFDLAIMCMSCNWARHWSPNNICPHQLACPNIVELAKVTPALNHAA